jgi:hypothetical protein
MADIYELPIKRDVPDCMDELFEVLKRHEGTLCHEDALNILGNLSMVFMGQDETRAAALLHETFLGITAFYDLPVVIERDRDGASIKVGGLSIR